MEDQTENKESNIENVVSPAETTKPAEDKENPKMIASAIIIAGVMIAGAVLLKGNTLPGVEEVSNNGVSNLTANINLRPASQEEHILGSVNAPVIIVEYSDTECPFCKTFHNTLHGVLNQNAGRVAWVYRHYPIPQLHQKAFHEAEATECAWDQGGNDAFWKYINEVFARTRSNDMLAVEELPKIAGDIGLNVTAFNACLASGKFKSKVEADMADGNSAGARGTPYSVVISKKEISPKMQSDIAQALVASGGRPDGVSFDSNNKKFMSINGALTEGMVNGIVTVLLK